MRSHAKAASAASTHREGHGSHRVIAACWSARWLSSGLVRPRPARRRKQGRAGPTSPPSGKCTASSSKTRAVDSGRLERQRPRGGTELQPRAHLLPDRRTDRYAGGGLIRGIAIDPSDDTLYATEVAAYGGTVIRRYVSDGQPTPTYTLDPTFEVPKPKGSRSTRRRATSSCRPGAEGVRRYDSSGTLLETIGTPSISPAWVVTASDGSFYVASGRARHLSLQCFRDFSRPPPGSGLAGSYHDQVYSSARPEAGSGLLRNG